MVDGCICLSDVSMTLVHKQFPALTCPATTVPHGHYRDVYPNTVSREDARRKLGIGPSAFVFVHVGMVRGYKNVPELIQAFREVEGDVALVVAGEVFDEGLKRRIVAAVEGEGRALLSLKRVGDDELQDYFSAADVAVFPYRDILNSGSALMALSFDTPVLVPAIGSMPELRETIGAEWVHTYDGAFGTKALKDAMTWATEVARQPRAPLDELDWSVLAKRTVEFYSQVLGS
jgi:glycosyltransferase involved in cell wall biosynthesis